MEENKDQNQSKRNLDLVNMGREIILPETIGAELAAIMKRALDELNEVNPLDLKLIREGNLKQRYLVTAHVLDSTPVKLLLAARVISTDYTNSRDAAHLNQ